MSKTTLQIPLETSLRDKATQVAFDLGFSSLQEAVRVYLKQLSDRKIGISLIRESDTEFLTLEQEKSLIEMESKVDADIKSGKFIKSSSVKELMDYLRD